MRIYEASQEYIENNIPTIIIAGKEYGTGSSRDWAAKGPALLGVRVVIAESFERIHRSNLIGMGIIPCEFMDGENFQTLGLTGYEEYEISDLDGKISPGSKKTVIVRFNFDFFGYIFELDKIISFPISPANIFTK